MGAKTGKGMLLCMLYSVGLVVTDVTGDLSLVGHRVTVTYRFQRRFFRHYKLFSDEPVCTLVSRNPRSGPRLGSPETGYLGSVRFGWW